LKKLFAGNEELLKDFFERKIEPTNLSAFEIVEDFRGLPLSEPYWFNNLKTMSELSLVRQTSNILINMLNFIKNNGLYLSLIIFVLLAYSISNY